VCIADSVTQTTCPLCGRQLTSIGSMAVRAGEAAIFECGECAMPLKLRSTHRVPFMFVIDANGTIHRPDLNPDDFA
jgi:hypothetical protein